MAREDGGRKIVAVMDSGVGGLPYLESARALSPELGFVYLADRAGFPYGTKTRSEVETIVRDRVSRLVDRFAPAAVVIACNTASQAALAAVRDDHPGLPVVGTVPAVKPAAAGSRSGIIGVLATERSVRDPYLDELERSHAGGVRVLRRAAQDLVTFVERRLFEAGTAEFRAVLLPHVEFLVEGGADEIVLACTHFLHVASRIEALANEVSARRGGGRVVVVDSRDGVARRLRSILGGPEGRDSLSRGGPGAGKSNGEDALYLTGDPPFETSYASFASRYGLSGPFPLHGDRS